ncbi:hypothetical protein BGW80DRAFT_1247926 [Lactifluus volemus]|nr:hypothetical protein BGW80DRAFT_1247926 [Lactifluus volemus]
MAPPRQSPPLPSPAPTTESVSSFVPRPFPPPSLVGVPHEYIVDSLRRLAPQYWNDTETTDCSIVYPVDNYPSGVIAHGQSAPTLNAEVLPNSHDPSSLGRRLTAPNLNREPMRVLMKLHIDYLSAQSTLLRALFSGSSPLDLIQPAAQLAPQGAGPSSRPSISASVASRLPRLLPSTADHPIVYLPIPDASSFPYLVTWMYFGETNGIEDALQRHVIRWDGLARNVEYLGMPEEIKRFLGSWYRRWLQHIQQSGSDRRTEGDEGDDTPRGRPAAREYSH